MRREKPIKIVGEHKVIQREIGETPTNSFRQSSPVVSHAIAKQNCSETNGKCIASATETRQTVKAKHMRRETKRREEERREAGREVERRARTRRGEERRG